MVITDAPATKRPIYSSTVSTPARLLRAACVMKEACWRGVSRTRKRSVQNEPPPAAESNAMHRAARIVACAIAGLGPPGMSHDIACNERSIPDSANPSGLEKVIGKTTIERAHAHRHHARDACHADLCLHPLSGIFSAPKLMHECRLRAAC